MYFFNSFLALWQLFNLYLFYCHFQLFTQTISLLTTFPIYVACPVGYKEVTSNANKTCLRFVDTPTHYPYATINCKEDGGDLVKLDTEPLKDVFLDFIDGTSITCILCKIIIDIKIVHFKGWFN